MTIPYQPLLVVYLPRMVITSNRESEFDSGEGVLEIATTSKEGSRHANYPFGDARGSDDK